MSHRQRRLSHSFRRVALQCRHHRRRHPCTCLVCPTHAGRCFHFKLMRFTSCACPELVLTNHLSFHPVFIAKHVQSEKRLPVFAPAQAPRAHPRGKARPPLRSNTQTSLVPPYPSVPRPEAERPLRKPDAARSLVSSAAPDLRGMKTYLLVCIVWMLSVCPKPVLANDLGFVKENGKLNPFCSPWTPWNSPKSGAVLSRPAYSRTASPVFTPRWKLRFQHEAAILRELLA